MLYAFVFIMDPRANMKGFHNVLGLLFNLTDTDSSRFPTYVHGELTKVFERYEAKLVMLTCIYPNIQKVLVLIRRKWLGIIFLHLM
jgi:hypothetical protein